MSTLLSTLSATPSVEILDALRGLERKTSLVFTLLKASVYSIVLQQQINEDPDVDEGHGMGLGGSRGSGM
jgi:DASH complex subunit DAD3